MANDDRVRAAETTDAFYNIGISHAINAISALPVASEWMILETKDWESIVDYWREVYIPRLYDAPSGIRLVEPGQCVGDVTPCYATHWRPHVAPGVAA
jgi:hypothetical protein